MFVLLFSLTVCRVENTESTASDYRDLLLSFDYGDEVTYVIGHKRPDSDTVGSAIAYADLLNEIGIRAEAVVSAPVNNETQYALDAFGEEDVREMADRMYQVMEDNYDTIGLDMLFTKINNKDEGASENMMYMVACGPGAEELLQEIYNNYDGDAEYCCNH